MFGRGDGSGGNANDGELWQEEDEAWLTSRRSPPAVRPVPNRPRTGSGPRPSGWGPLIYMTLPITVPGRADGQTAFAELN